MNFFDDLNKLNQGTEDNEFSDLNSKVYDEHDYILDEKHNSQFFYSLCEFCKNNYPDLPSNKGGFFKKDLDQIIYIDTFFYMSYFQNVTSLNELQYFHNLEIIEIYSFKSCKELKSIIFPENLQIIHACAFSKCSSLKKIIIPERFKNDMKYIFYGVDLTNVDITYI